MKKSILVGLVALGLVACGAKEEPVVEAAPAADVAAPAEAPAVEAAPAETGGVPVDAAAVAPEAK